MLLILIVLLILLVIIVYYSFERDIFSPSVISILMFVVSTFFASINKNEWYTDLSVQTVVLIFFGMFPLILGELFVRMFYQKKHGLNRVNIKRNFIPNEKMYINNKWIVSTVVILSLYLAYKLFYVYSVVGIYGIQDTLLGSFRSATYSEEFELNPIIKIGDLFTASIAYFYAYIFINIMVYQRKIKIKYLFPVILFLIIYALSSARIQFIFFVVFALVTWYIMLQNKSNWKFRLSTKFIRIGGISIILFLITFYFLGFLTGKSTDENIIDYISLYVGGSIPALNIYLQTFEYDISNFGSTTLIGINNILKRLGFEGFETYRNLEFSFIGEYTRTNVYTTYGRLLNDFGFLGMFIIRFLVGLIYTYVYLNIKYKYYRKNEDFMILIYGFVFFPIVMQAIDDTLFKNIIAITVVGQIVILYILFWMLKNNHPRKL